MKTKQPRPETLKEMQSICGDASAIAEIWAPRFALVADCLVDAKEREIRQEILDSMGW